MAQWIEHLPHKHKDKSSYPQNSWKSQARMEAICNPNPGEGEIERDPQGQP